MKKDSKYPGNWEGKQLKNSFQINEIRTGVREFGKNDGKVFGLFVSASQRSHWVNTFGQVLGSNKISFF